MIECRQKEGKKMTETPSKRYKRENILTIWLKLNRKTEPELVKQVENQPNKNGYLKSLIRRDIEKK